MNGNEKKSAEEIEIKKDPHCERVKNSFLGVLKSGELDQIIDRFIRKESHVQIVKTLLYVITILIAVAGFFLSWYATYESNKFQAQIAYNERQAQHIRDVIKEKRYWANQLIGSIMDMRETRITIVINCLHKTPFSLRQQALMRMKTEYRVIRAISKSRTVFKNKGLIDTIIALNKFEESIPDVCAKNAPSNEAWRQYQNKVVLIIENSINADEQQLLKLKEK
jgi:hypothetical protein